MMSRPQRQIRDETLNLEEILSEKENKTSEPEKIHFENKMF